MTTRRILKPSELAVLEFVEEYGGGINFGGAGASSAKRNAARTLIAEGHLEGSHQHVRRITESGRHLLRLARRRAAAKKRLQFKRDRKEFEGADAK